MSNHLPFFYFPEFHSKPEGRKAPDPVKPRKEILQQILAYSRALEVLKTPYLTGFCILN